MRYLKTNTAVIVTVGPFYDKTDGVTIETALTITNERITMTADTDDGAAPTNILDNVTGATSGTSNDLNYITGNDAGMMQLELSAANVNRLGRMFLSITDAANHCPVFHEFMVLPAVIYDAMILGTDLFDVSVTQLGGVAQSLTDLKDFADDGYDPATNKVQGVVLTDTVTTYTGNTPQTGDSFARIGATGSGLTSLATQASVNTIDDFIDTEVAAIQADLDDIQTRLPAALTTGTSDSGTTTTMVDAARTEADTDYWKGLWIRFTSGNISGQTRLITGFTPASDTITFAPVTTQAVGTHTYEILPANRVDLGQWLGSTPNALVSSRVDALVGAMGTDVLTAASLNADAVTEIQVGLATAAALDVVDNFLDTEIAAIISTLGTPAGVSISADIAAIEAQTDDIGAAGAGLTAVPWNAAWDTEVQSEANDALVANNLDHLVLIAVDTDFATTVHLDSVIGHLADNGTTATFSRTTDSLEALEGKIDAVDNFVDTEVAAIITTLGTPAGASISADILTIDNLVDDLESRLGTPSNLGSGATVAANLVDIEGQTDDIGVAGAGLTTLATAASIAALNNLSAAQVNAEVVDALNVDTYAEPGQEAPPATTTLVKKLGYLYKFLRNKKTQTATTLSIFADDATTVDQKATISDDATTYTHNEIVTGP